MKSKKEKLMSPELLKIKSLLNSHLVELVKPQELFFSGLVDPVAELFFRFTCQPNKTFGLTPCAVSPTHIEDFGRFRL
jgi:hypothetical protein